MLFVVTVVGSYGLAPRARSKDDCLTSRVFRTHLLDQGHVMAYSFSRTPATGWRVRSLAWSVRIERNFVYKALVLQSFSKASSGTRRKPELQLSIDKFCTSSYGLARNWRSKITSFQNGQRALSAHLRPSRSPTTRVGTPCRLGFAKRSRRTHASPSIP